MFRWNEGRRVISKLFTDLKRRGNLEDLILTLESCPISAFSVNNKPLSIRASFFPGLGEHDSQLSGETKHYRSAVRLVGLLLVL